MRPALLACLLLSSCGAAEPAFAQHPAHDQAIHETFYKDWMRPDFPTGSCCDDRDCAPVEQVRQNSKGQWEALRTKDAQWVTIPEAKIEWNRDSPDGRSHMCSIGPTVFCFVLGSGS